MDDTTGGDGSRAPVGLLESLCRAWLATAPQDQQRGAAVVRASAQQLETALVATDALAAHLIDLHQTLGEGPALRALDTRSPVIVHDLAGSDHGTGWVAFDREAAAAGARSYWALPLQIGVVSLGVVTVHATAPDALLNGDLGSLLSLADALAVATMMPNELDPAGPAPAPLLSSTRAIVHQACGMVMVQIEATMRDALVALRGHAYGSGRSLEVVSRDVVEGRLRFFPGGADPETLDDEGL